MPFGASPVTHDPEIVTVLKKARALIDSPEKWGKFGIASRPGHCVLRAFGSVGGHGEDDHWIKPASVLAQTLGLPHAADLMIWNDAPERTHADVMDAFDKAIILAGGTP